ncbi:DNA-3-methyladenine glycosylase family protein [Paramicrobacterium agarici]|uniref:DNA-3-methyladenine glycosylase II n=1 Tax=Paramicrobacterium agarici TaxID=630514 RepID=A0A2A9DSR3_9MICO|nr:AlkA N-terminal domain-containing protein [Microbacterium agarici]PFG29195.1 DNA-3-methyladenine glycosylase II [Microbacterium agarici]TQO22159.1 DNA-3-methyladenine glycosylase II [Microbacterium agarici]
MHSLPHTLDLPFAPPYDVDALLAAQRTHAVPGIDAPESPLAAPDTIQDRTAEPPDAVITRGIRHNGLRGTIRVTFGDDRVTLTSSLPIDAELARRVRRWLDLDADPATATEQFGTDPVIGPLIGKRPGLRIFGHIDDLEAACFAVLGQQVSLASARTFQRRFVAAFGALDTATGFRHLPDAAEIAALDPLEIRDAIGLTRSRAATLHAVVGELAAGLTLDGDADSIRHRLLAITGIGPWTADYLAVRAIGDRNAFPAGDLVLRRAMGAADAREATRRSEPWHPLRAYATFHLWTEHAYCAVR